MTTGSPVDPWIQLKQSGLLDWSLVRRLVLIIIRTVLQIKNCFWLESNKLSASFQTIPQSIVLSYYKQYCHVWIWFTIIGPMIHCCIRLTLMACLWQTLNTNIQTRRMSYLVLIRLAKCLQRIQSACILRNIIAIILTRMITRIFVGDGAIFYCQAGCGKTTKLIKLAAEATNPIILSFTNKAIENVKSRIDDSLCDKCSFVWHLTVWHFSFEG